VSGIIPHCLRAEARTWTQAPLVLQVLESQNPLHADSQQTDLPVPSFLTTQVSPDWHSDVEPHTSPWGRDTQRCVVALQSGLAPEQPVVPCQVPVVSHVCGILPMHRVVPGLHEPPQAFPTHVYWQLTCVTPGQLPLASQVAPLIWRLFEQLCPRHVLAANVHFVCDTAALQLPVHEGSLPVHRLRAGEEARWGVPVTPVQVPAEPLTSQA
jgi:hypothetical protein